jgi:hypothetical protein
MKRHLVIVATGTVTFSGGSGVFTHFHAAPAVSPGASPNVAWNGTYSFSPDGRWNGRPPALRQQPVRLNSNRTADAFGGHGRPNAGGHHMMKRLFTLVPLVTVLGLGALAGTASADPGPTPNGFTGAANMKNAGDGMTHAMSVNNPNGNLGMQRAVCITSVHPREHCYQPGQGG